MRRALFWGCRLHIGSHNFPVFLFFVFKGTAFWFFPGLPAVCKLGWGPSPLSTNLQELTCNVSSHGSCPSLQHMSPEPWTGSWWTGIPLYDASLLLWPPPPVSPHISVEFCLLSTRQTYWTLFSIGACPSNMPAPISLFVCFPHSLCF